MSEELKEVRSDGKGIAVAALIVGCVALLAVVFWAIGKTPTADKDTVTTVEIVRLVNSADKAVDVAEASAASVKHANDRIAALEKAMRSRMQEMMSIAKRVDSVAVNHNVLVTGMQQEQASDKASRSLMEMAIIRLHSKADWVGAVTASQVEMAEERQKRADLQKKLEESKKNPPPLKVRPRVDKEPDVKETPAPKAEAKKDKSADKKSVKEVKK